MTDSERDIFIKEKLGISSIRGLLSSPNGIYTVKIGMIMRGYSFECGYKPHHNKENPWYAHFGMTRRLSGLLPQGKTEAQAILLAAYKALNWENDTSKTPL